MSIDPRPPFTYDKAWRATKPGSTRRSIMKKRAKHKCPECGYHFNWVQRTEFLKGIGVVRKGVACPQCNTPLVWRKGPFVLQNLTALAYLIAMGFLIAGYGSGKWVIYLVAGALLIFVILQLTERLVKADRPAPES
jgi:endogenous inhibitor of DNA gyrase (YacG/DUF329 family)